MILNQKKMKIIKIVDIIFLALLAILIVLFVLQSKEYLEYQNTLKCLDSIERQYDADDLFIVIDRDNGAMGLYDRQYRIADTALTEEVLETIEESDRKDIPFIVVRPG